MKTGRASGSFTHASPDPAYPRPTSHYSAQIFAVCSAATTGGLALKTWTVPRHKVHAGRIVRYKVSIRPTTKYAKAKKASAGAQAAAPILNLRVTLPADVKYISSVTSPSLYALGLSGRKIKRQPVQSNNSMVLTWEDIGATRKGRTFKVKTRVDSATASGTLLTFSAQLYESVQVGSGFDPACAVSASDVTLPVV